MEQVQEELVQENQNQLNNFKKATEQYQLNIKNQETMKKQEDEIKRLQQELDSANEALRNVPDPANAPTVVADREAYRAHIQKLNDEIQALNIEQQLEKKSKDNFLNFVKDKILGQVHQTQAQ